MYLGEFNDIFTEALNSRGLNVLFLQFSAFIYVIIME